MKVEQYKRKMLFSNQSVDFFLRYKQGSKKPKLLIDYYDSREGRKRPLILREKKSALDLASEIQLQLRDHFYGHITKVETYNHRGGTSYAVQLENGQLKFNLPSEITKRYSQYYWPKQGGWILIHFNREQPGLHDVYYWPENKEGTAPLSFTLLDEYIHPQP